MQEDERNKSAENARARNVSRGLGSLTLQSITTSILAYVFLVVLIRLVSPTDYTAYSSVYVSIAIAVIVSTFGLQYAAARYVALFLAEDNGDYVRAWRAARTVMIISLLFSGISALTFGVLSPSLSIYFMKSTHYTFLFQLGGLFLFAYSYSNILQSVVQGLKKYVLLAKMLTSSRAAMVLFTILGLIVTRSVSIAIIAWIIYYSILIVWSTTIIARNLIPKTLDSTASIISKFRPWFFVGPGYGGYYSMIMRYTLPLAVSAIFLVISTGGDSIILGHETTLLGAYNVAVNISAALNLVLIVPLTTAFLPEVSSSLRSQAEISNGVRLSLRFLMLALLPASFLIAALSNQLISAFSGGGVYLQGVGPLQLVAVTYTLAGITLAMFSLLQGTGRTIEALILSGILAGVDLSFALLLVPQIGIMGAALSKSMVALVGMAVGFYFARRYLGFLDTASFYLKCLIAAAIPSLAVFSLSMFVSDRTVTVIPYAILGGLIFLACVKCLKILSSEDRSYLSHVLPSSLQKLLRFL